MTIETRNNITVLFAGDGMLLTNGEAYGTEVWLSRFDSIDNWHEIREEDKPSDNPAPEEDDKADMQAAINIYEGGTADGTV